MTKKKPQKKIITPQVPLAAEPKFLPFLYEKRNQLLIVVALALGFYANTLMNQFALDDGMVLSNNKLVLKGVSAIPDILSHDSFYGAIGDTKNLSGGRYRPLSLVSYAIEVSFFGKNPLVDHLVNVLLYALTAVVLLRLLSRFIFPKASLAAFCATILFVIHPVHTEAVANIKGRDEIFSLLFLLLTLYYLLLNVKEHKKTLLRAVLCYLLAMFSKENGLIFLAMIPLTIFFFTEKKISAIILTTLPFFAVAGFYLIIRFALLGTRNHIVTEVMDNPYVLATQAQKYATIFFVFLKYLQLLVFPHPLTYDYSYQQIPYQAFSNPSVLISILIYVALGVVALTGLKKKSIFSWCIIFYFGTLFLVSNLIFNIGAPMGERFLYQASVPFVIAMIELMRRFFFSVKTNSMLRNYLAAGLMSVPVCISCYATVTRNTNWKDDNTLLLHDVKISAQSARANTYAGITMLRLNEVTTDSIQKRDYAQQSLVYFKKSMTIKADYMPTFLNMGVAYARLDSMDLAADLWNKAKVHDPTDPNLKRYFDYLYQVHFNKGMAEGKKGNYQGAIDELEKAVECSPANADGWYNLGGVYYTVSNFEKAKMCFQKTLQLNPNYKLAQQALLAIQAAGH